MRFVGLVASWLCLGACASVASRDFEAALERGRVREALRVYDERSEPDPAELQRLAEAVLVEESRATDVRARRRVFPALASAGTAAESVLRRILARPYDPWSRAQALRLLARLRDRAAREALSAEASSPDGEIAALAIELLDPASELPRLIDLASAPQKEPRLAAMRVLARAEPGDQTRLLLARVARSDPERSVRVEALRALGGQGPAAADTLLERLEDGEPAVRLAACEALVRADPVRAAQRLERELLGAPTELAIHAAFALLGAVSGASHAVGWAPDGSVVSPAPPGTARAFPVMEAARSQIARALWDPSLPLRSQAAFVVTALGSPELLELAGKRLSHEGTRSIRLSLALALGPRREEGRAALTELLKQDDVPGAQAAAALARSGDRAAEQRLVVLLSSKHARVRALAGACLAHDRRRPHEVRALLVDADAGVRIAAAVAILGSTLAA